MNRTIPTSASASEQTGRGLYSPGQVGVERIATASLRLPVVQPILTTRNSSAQTVGLSFGLVFGTAGWQPGYGYTVSSTAGAF